MGRFSRLTTESRNPDTLKIDSKSAGEIISFINSEDAKVAKAVAKEKRNIEKAVLLIRRSLAKGGQLIFVGAGTSGRLGVAEAAECPPTFNTPSKMVRAIIAGGKGALTHSIEGAEDNASDAIAQISKLKPQEDDVVVGISASGLAPFVKSALGKAKGSGSRTILITCNQKRATIKPDVIIAPVVGPEVIAGSTRLKAGTATKMVLNMLTTATMILLGKTYRNWMVDVQPRSAKLRERALHIIEEICGVKRSRALKYLKAARNNTKVAILMAKKRLPYNEAKNLLDRCWGFLQKAIDGEN